MGLLPHFLVGSTCPYWIIALDPEYRYAAVGPPSSRDGAQKGTNTADQECSS